MTTGPLVKLSIYVYIYFPFGFEGRIRDLFVLVPDYCLPFYFKALASRCAVKK